MAAAKPKAQTPPKPRQSPKPKPAAPAEELPVADRLDVVVVDGRIDEHRPSRPDLGAGGRTLKVMRPMCHTDESRGFIGCQEKYQNAVGWWDQCDHDPYYSVVIEEIKVDEWDEEPDADGNYAHLGTKKIRRKREVANIGQLTLSPRHGGLVAVQQKMARKGFILPEEHPTRPRKPYCQFRDCYSQDIKFKTSAGWYCRGDQARINIMFEEDEGTLEVLSTKKRSKQLRQVSI